jgi:hypothetical protein
MAGNCSRSQLSTICGSPGRRVPAAAEARVQACAAVALPTPPTSAPQIAPGSARAPCHASTARIQTSSAADSSCSPCDKPNASPCHRACAVVQESAWRAAPRCRLRDTPPTIHKCAAAKNPASPPRAPAIHPLRPLSPHEYAVPPASRAQVCVHRCRAFSVPFGHLTLGPKKDGNVRLLVYCLVTHVMFLQPFRASVANNKGGVQCAP